MKKKVKKILILVLGFTFVVLGLLGLVLPFLQGILFLIIGIFILSFVSTKFQKWVKQRTEKYSFLSKNIKIIEIWIEKVFGKI